MIDTDRFSSRLRERAIRSDTRQLLIARIVGTDQQADMTLPPNCGGLGRIRHFQRDTSAGWPSNPLPIDPAAWSLGLEPADLCRAQAFQLGACNWRCWYCFVPFSLLAANPRHAEWRTAEQLLQSYAEQDDPPPVIDLTGGQPDLTPEWVPWMIEALKDTNLHGRVYLWSDDNLSNDYFWRYLSDAQREAIASYPHYGRVGCFKGFDEESFAINTAADASLFDRQFELMRRLLTTGIDVYAYVTFPTPRPVGIQDRIARFVDRLQDLHPNLPLRTVPLEIQVYTPVVSRMNEHTKACLENQQRAVEAWALEIEKRFSSDQRSSPVPLVSLSSI